jgi:hypothetical protein
MREQDKIYKHATALGFDDNGNMWINLNTPTSIIVANDNVVFEYMNDLYVGKVSGEFDSNEAKLKWFNKTI